MHFHPRLLAWALTLAVLGLVCVSASAATDSVLDVTVDYRGQGTVDDRHALVLLLFDGPDLGQFFGDGRVLGR